MLDIKTILFPTDYSVCAEHAFSQAAYLAERYEATVHVLHVTEPAEAPLVPGITQADVAADLRLPPPEAPRRRATPGTGQLHNVEVAPVDGSVAQAIVTYAAEHDVDVIVMGTHGRGGAERLILGSVARKVVRLAGCPVFTVHQAIDTALQGTVRRILVPVDFSDHARLASAYAIDLAAAYGAHLDLLHVIEEIAMPVVYGVEPVVVQIPDVEPEARAGLELMAEDARQAGVSVKTHIYIGHPARAIIDCAEDEGTDLIVIATHGLTGLKRFFLGSVAEKIVQRAPCPVFTVKGFGKVLLPAVARLTEQSHA